MIKTSTRMNHSSGQPAQAGLPLIGEDDGYAKKRQ
jgi:hypothetical protein